MVDNVKDTPECFHSNTHIVPYCNRDGKECKDGHDCGYSYEDRLDCSNMEFIKVCDDCDEELED